MSPSKRRKLGALGLPLSESPADVQLAWKKEIRRRLAEIRAGRAVLIPAEVAMRRARRMLARMDRQRGMKAVKMVAKSRSRPKSASNRSVSARRNLKGN